MVFTITLFALSLTGIAGLFTLKYWEVRHERTYVAELRVRADEYAMLLKQKLTEKTASFSRVWPMVSLIARYFVHRGALAAARMAHRTSVEAHRVADLVSHKHRHVPRPPRSEFLQKVAEVKVELKNSVTQTFDIQ